MKYTYEAGLVNPGQWMVKRFKDDGSWDEALIEVDTTDPDEAIKAAVARGSWA